MDAASAAPNPVIPIALISLVVVVFLAAIILDIWSRKR